MTKTFNRMPTQVNIPAIEHQFFNHTNWKGACSNKNFLSIDQETFEDCNNVYIDADNVLKSRPAIKVDTTRQRLLNNEKIMNVWFFDIVEVYLTQIENEYKLVFVQDSTVAYTHTLTLQSVNDIKLLYIDRHIFIFTSSIIQVYDIENKSIKSAVDYVYIPTTKVIVDGIEDDNNAEALVANELTDSYITKYIFSNLSSAVFDKLVDSNVTLTIDDVQYNFTFVDDNELAFVQKTSSFSENNFAYEHMLGIDSTNIPLISVSDNNSFIITSASYTVDAMNRVNVDMDIYFTADGYSFRKLPHLDDIYGMPKLSKDGIYVFAFTKRALNIINVLTDAENNMQYPIWTNILEKLNWKYHSYVTFDESSIFTQIDTTYNKNVCVNGEFITDDIFAFVATLPVTTDAYDANIQSKITATISYATPLSTSLVCVYCKNGVFYEDILEGISSADVNVSVNSDNTVGSNNVFTPIANLQSKLAYSTADAQVVGGIGVYGNISADSTKLTLHLRHFTQHGDIYHDGNIDITIDYKVGTYVVGNDYAAIYIDIKSIANNRIQMSILMLPYISIDYRVSFIGLSTPNISVYNDETSLKIAISVLSSTLTKTQPYQMNTKGYCIELLTTETSVMHGVLNAPIGNNVYDICQNDLYNGILTSAAGFTFAIKRLSNGIQLYQYTTAVVAGKISFNQNIERITDVTVDKNSRMLLFADYTSIYIATNTFIYNSKRKIPLLFEAIPAHVNTNGQLNLFFVTNSAVYSSNAVKNLTISVTTAGDIHSFVPDIILTADNQYFTKNNTLYISASTEDKLKLYFPIVNTQQFDEDISALHPISSTQIGVFLPSSIFYITSTEYGYTYTKSKLQVGCAKNTDVVTSQDGKNIIFSSTRGLVALSYQDFVSSTEQTLSYLSDVVFSKYKLFNVGTIKLFLFDYWLICYRDNYTKGFVFDLRNLSMWPVEYTQYIHKIENVNNKPLILSNNKIKYFDTSDNNYADDVGKINWFLLSQKLHLNAANYDKRISSIMLSSVANAALCNMKLEITNYRKRVDKGSSEIIEYSIDVVRTFVKRVNYPKVSEFQYMLSADLENAIQVPLSLTNISIKYLVTGVIR